jgi:hypothetical protein
MLHTCNTNTKYCYYRYRILLIPILNTIKTDTKYKQYLSHLWFYYYSTFLRLRRECHIQNLLEQNRNLDQFLSKSNAIWHVSDQFKVLTYLGGGPCPQGALKNYSNKWGSNPCPLGQILISLSSRTHLILIPLSSHVRHATQVRWCKISSINRITCALLVRYE